jgi:membrane peptidoglycan carboxypeptidase
MNALAILGGLLSVLAPLVLRKDCDLLEAHLREIRRRQSLPNNESWSPNFVKALLAAEDRRFFRHRGVDPLAVGRAIWRMALEQTWHGGSTVEQQLVRTLTRRYERTISRKIREMFLASRVSVVVPKEEIPDLYLSIAYFGWKMNGVRSACRRLGISAARASIAEAASVVSRLKYPQPRLCPPYRIRQISMRTAYLLEVLGGVEPAAPVAVLSHGTPGDESISYL